MILISVYFSYTIQVRNAWVIIIILLWFYNDNEPRSSVDELISDDEHLTSRFRYYFFLFLQNF